MTKNSAEAKKLRGQATDEQIAAWKQENPDGIYFIKNSTDIAYYREPMLQDIESAINAADPESPFSGTRYFMELTFIGGSEAMHTDDKMFGGARKQAAKHFEFGDKATSGNL